MTAPSSPFNDPSARFWRTDELSDVSAFHRTLPGYDLTRLVEVPAIAEELAVGRVFVKEESFRLGLPAFKILGASYAISRALSARFGLNEPAASLQQLGDLLRAHDSVELVAATDGNHGRAVAHMGRLLGIPSRIFLPSELTDAAKSAITSEGAHAVELKLPYDDVVAAAAAYALSKGEGVVLVQDTAWPGYEEVPQWIVDGYSTLFEETDEQLARAGIERVDLVAVPVGVGSLAQAAVRHHRSGSRSGASVLSVEAANAPSMIESLHAGRPVTVTTFPTVMTGLNCGTPSMNAWPALHAGLDAAITVSDAEAIRAVADLEALGLDAGPCGAATLAGLRAWNRYTPLAADAVILLVSTEGRAANPLPAAQ
jgi:diaminopropionate ammonia-lyase